MSELKVNKITPKTGTSIQLGESGDTITIPCGATLTNNGTATGFGLSFCTTVKTSPFTATANKGFLINTGSAVTVTLPASPSTGAEVIIVDQTGQAATNNITLGRNGSKIKGGCTDLLMVTNRGGLRLVYSGSSQGWITATAGNDATATPAYMSASGGTETTSGNYKIHTFTSDGTFTVDRTAVSAPNNEVSYIVVAGGGGSSIAGGGGGGFRESKAGVDSYTSSPLEGSTNITVTAQGYPITVGGGGAGAAIPGTAVVGSNSVFSTVTSAGGGLGATNNATGGNGGSGGGGGGGSGPYAAGSGNTPPTSPSQGFDGGIGGNTPPNNAGGGGGGATAAGGTTTSTVSGAGGAGATTSITGSPTAYSGGGGGGARNAPANQGGAGGTGGGGAGKPYSPGNGTSGTTNTGGGGGGAGSEDLGGTGGAGGSGIVVIRYRYQ
jgi:hypothetical protein